MNTKDEQELRQGDVMEAVAEAWELASMHLGQQLGFYEAIGEDSVTASELTRRTAVEECFASAWLDQQVAAGHVERTGGDASYCLTASGMAVLPSTPATTSDLVASAVAVLENATVVHKAFRGRAVREDDYPSEAATVFPDLAALDDADTLVQALRDAAPSLGDRIAAGKPVRIIVIESGAGATALALARAIPTATITGFASDDLAVFKARRRVLDCQLEGRVTFEVMARLTPDSIGTPDLIVYLGGFQSSQDPGAVISWLREIGSGRSVQIVALPRSNRATGAGDLAARLLAAHAVLHVLPLRVATRRSAAVPRPIDGEELAQLVGGPPSSVTRLEVPHWLCDFYAVTS